jgi:hypothetical protein
MRRARPASSRGVQSQTVVKDGERVEERVMVEAAEVVVGEGGGPGERGKEASTGEAADMKASISPSG